MNQKEEYFSDHKKMEKKVSGSKTSSLKTYLAGFSKEQLIGQILELSRKFKAVKTYYDFSISPDSSNASEKAKAAVLHGFYPSRGHKLRLKEARKAITDFKKLSPDEESFFDVMLFYVECGVRFTNDFGDINEPFYNSLANVFRQAGAHYQKLEKSKAVQDRARRIMIDTTDVGWGFHEDASDVYYNYFD